MPSNNQVTSKYYMGQGVLLIAPRLADGLPGGFTNVGNVSDLKIGLKTNVVEHKETSTGARGIDKRLTTEISCDVTATLESINSDNLAMAVRGSLSEVVAGSVSTTPEEVKVYLGKTSSLKNIKVAVTEVKTTGGTPVVLLAGTDYTVNDEAGSINFAATIAGVVDGDVVEVKYTYAKQSKIESMTQGMLEYVLRFEGLNTAETNPDGSYKSVVVQIHRFASDPLKELALITDKIGDISLAGSALADLTKGASESKYFTEWVEA